MVYRRGNSKYYWYKFQWKGRTIRESTKQANKRTAKLIEAARRTELAKSEVGLGSAIPASRPRSLAGRCSIDSSIAMSELKDQTLSHQSGVNPKGEPFVQLLLDGRIIAQLSPELARDHARAITEAAEAAEQDAFLFDWITRQVGAGPEQAAGMHADFRRYRAERTGKSQGPTNAGKAVVPLLEEFAERFKQAIETECADKPAERVNTNGVPVRHHTTQAWNKIANNLGYKNEAAMLRDLYEAQGMPASKIAIMCGCSYNTIRNRLRRYGLKQRPLSKPRPYRGSLSALGDEQLFSGSAIEAAEACGVHRSTVHRERLRRKAASSLATTIDSSTSEATPRPTDWVMPPPDKIPDYGDFTKKKPKP